MQANNIKFPYGISSIEKLIEQGYVFVDKTKYIELLEKEDSYSIFLRPRRMGKSLFVSMLEHYYDINKKHLFEKVFSNLYIGKNPTPRASSYMVLSFDFSAIDTQTEEAAFRFFLKRIQSDMKSFMKSYNLFESEEIEIILDAGSPGDLMSSFFRSLKTWRDKTGDNRPIFIVIDEYDHFTNEILIRDLSEFKRSVSEDGYIRKFYEAIKTATKNSFVDRFFITGVSPITLDGLTSGFNIGKYLTGSEIFQDMMGFSEEETRNLLNLVLEDKSREQQIMSDLKFWYNGYRFNLDVEHTIYNSDMVLYFLDNFKFKQKYPKQMLDPNIMPDYSKLKKLFNVANYQANIEVLEEILQNGYLINDLIYQFSFDQDFDRTAFVNLLFYLGNLTLDGADEYDTPRFVIPNYVIKELYWKYFANVLQKEAKLEYESNNVMICLRKMVAGDIGPMFELIEKLLQNLSNRDFQRFDEKYIKAILLAYVHQSRYYYARTEREVTNDGYIDIELLQHPANHGNIQQYVIELKYLKKSEENLLESTMQSAKTQLKSYLENDIQLKTLQKLKAIAVVTIKDKIHWEIVNG